MKAAFILLFIIWALQLDAQFSKTEFKKLHSLAGIWVIKGNDFSTLETWKLENDSSLTGASYTIKDKDTALQETVSLTLRKGVITYIPVTKGQNQEQPVIFTLKEKKVNSFSFTNPAHDFPQVITYNLVNENRLVASISGKVSGRDKYIEYPYERQKL